MGEGQGEYQRTKEEEAEKHFRHSTRSDNMASDTVQAPPLRGPGRERLIWYLARWSSVPAGLV